MFSLGPNRPGLRSTNLICKVKFSEPAANHPPGCLGRHVPWEWSLHHNEHCPALAPTACLASYDLLHYLGQWMKRPWLWTAQCLYPFWYLSYRTMCYYLFTSVLLSLHLTCKHFKVNDYNLSSSLFPTCLEMATICNCWLTDPFSTLYIKESQYIKRILEGKAIIIGNKSKASLSYLLCQVNNITLMGNKLLLFWVPTQRFIRNIWGINFPLNWFLSFSVTFTSWLWQSSFV